MGTPTVSYNGTSGGISELVSVIGENIVFVTGTFTFSTSYATGGEALDLSTMLNGATLKGVVLPTDGTRIFAYDYTNKLVLAYSALATQVVATTNLSAVSIKFIAWGAK